MSRMLSSALATSRRNGGWSMLEVALVSGLVALLMVAVLALVRTSVSPGEADGEGANLAGVRHALAGYALVHNRLPLPLEATPSAAHAAYLEGWLPSDVLGLSEVPRSVRYMVRKSFTVAPVTSYRADPLGLAGGLVVPRSSMNGLDLCLALYSADAGETGVGTSTSSAGATSTGNIKAVYALRSSTQHGEGEDAAWSPSLTADGRGRGREEAIGFLELADRLGCFQAWGALAASVRQTAVFNDLAKIGAVTMQVRELDRKRAKEELTNTIWRISTRSALLVQGTYNFFYTVLAAETGPFGRAAMAAELAGISSAVTGTIYVIYLASISLYEKYDMLDYSERKEKETRDYVRQLESSRDTAAARANRLQAAGLLP